MSKLKEILKKNGMTQKELSKKTGVSQTHITYFITGRSDLSLKTAKKIADVLEIKIDDLI